MNFNKYKNVTRDYDVDFFKYKQRKNLKKLTFGKKKSLGRSKGTIVSWHKGGGVKRRYRLLYSHINDREQNCIGILRSIEYDPNRSAFIGVIQFRNGAFTQIVVSSTMNVGDIVSFSEQHQSFMNVGDFTLLRNVPVGAFVFNLEKYPGSGSVFSKSAGVSSKLLTKDSIYGKVKLPSGEERLFDLNCRVTLGISSNVHHKFHKLYKAGTSRLLNRRPVVRGTAMNPIDHPHGGGAGKTAPGRPSVSPWGKLTKGVPTRKRNLKNKFIVKRRK